MEESLPNIHRKLNLYLPFDKPPKVLRRRRRQVEKENYATTKEVISLVQPDVIFVWSLLRVTLGPARAAQDSGVPVAYTFNDEYMAGFSPAPFVLRPRALIRYALDTWIFPGTSSHDLNFKNVTCISYLLKNSLCQKGLPIDKARVIYHGIVLDNFPPKTKMGHIETPARVLYMGQLQPYKGVHTLIEAAHMASDGAQTEPLSVSIVGDGPQAYKHDLYKLATAGRADVRFVGKVDHAEVSSIYRAHDFLVFPSTWQEPFGLTHLEAMASGIPVISTADGGQGEFLEDEKNALVFEKENVPQLAACIRRLIQEENLGPFLARNARKGVAREFTVQRYLAELESFLDEAISVKDETKLVKRNQPMNRKARGAGCCFVDNYRTTM